MKNNKEVKNGQAERLKAEALRYFKNGKTTIRKTKIRNGEYSDVKPVQEAAGVIYLGVLKALNAFALMRGYEKSNLPQDVQEYRNLLRKHPVHDGKLMDAFNDVYSYLHLGVYYRDNNDVDYVKKGLGKARFVIEQLTGKRAG